MAEPNDATQMAPTTETLRLSEIVFDERLYPRAVGHDPERVQVYARDLEQIEAAGKYISVNSSNVLVDGRHRQLAYKKRADGLEDPVVPVYRYAVEAPLDTVRLACRLQEKGAHLTERDRAGMTRWMYAAGATQKQIAADLCIGASTVSRWLTDVVRDEKRRRQDKVQEMWRACYSLSEIATEAGVDKATVSRWTDELLQSCTRQECNTFHGLDVPWHDQWDELWDKPEWVDYLLKLYTTAGGVVVDPFAGDGSTAAICRRYHRRCLASDPKPPVEREHEIRQHDVVDADGSISLLKPPQWKAVELVYLNPPPWDWQETPLEQYTATLVDIVHAYGARLPAGARIALVTQPTQVRAPEYLYADHYVDIGMAVQLRGTNGFCIPLNPAMYSEEDVKWATDNKKCLVLNRKIMMWRVPGEKADLQWVAPPFADVFDEA